MTNCCQEKACDLEVMARRHAKVLWIVLGINLIMFFVEAIAGIKAESTALLGDSLDMLGDAIAYGSSLFVLRAGSSSKAKSASLKGALMLILGVTILGRAIHHFQTPGLPEADIMTAIGLIALAANGLCLFLLSRHREDDLNMKSVWICSRNDIVANISVLAAAGLVWQLQSAIPDLVVGVALSVLFTRSAISVLKEASAELRSARVSA
jgi:cation diffusion facilitator family transporter